MRRPNKTVTKIKSTYINEYDAQKKSSNLRKKRLKQRLAITAVIMMTVFFVFVTYHMKQYKLHADKQKAYDTLTEELKTLEKKEKELQEEIDLLNDEEYILDIARTNYFLSKEGELIFQSEKDTDRSY